MHDCSRHEKTSRHMPRPFYRFLSSSSYKYLQRWEACDILHLIYNTVCHSKTLLSFPIPINLSHINPLTTTSLPVKALGKIPLHQSYADTKTYLHTCVCFLSLSLSVFELFVFPKRAHVSSHVARIRLNPSHEHVRLLLTLII